MFSPDPVPEIWHEIPGIETGQDLAIDVMLPKFLCSLRSDGNHAGEPAHAGCDDLCREGAGEEDAVELAAIHRFDKFRDLILADRPSAEGGHCNRYDRIARTVPHRSFPSLQDG